MSYVHHTTLQSRRSFACLAAVSLASVLAAAATTLAAPIGDPVKPATGGQGNALIQKSGSAPAGVVRISAVAASPAKAAAKPAVKAAAKPVAPPAKKAAPAAKPAPPVAKPAAGTPAPASGAPASGDSTPPPAQAQAAVAGAQPLILLANLNAGQYFSPEMQAQNVQELLVLFQHNFDPSSLETGKVSGEKVVKAVLDARGANPSGWVMLDYEVPFDSIFWNGKSDPRYATMMTSMIDALKYAKEKLPDCKFTYFGVPNVRYYVSNKGWESMPASTQVATKNDVVALYIDLVKAMDWISPCIYDRFDAAMETPVDRDALVARERLYRANVTSICDALRDAAGKPDMPIIPSVSVVYEDHGKATVWGTIGHDEFRSDQIDPCIANGADGFFLWSSLEYNAWVASLSWVPTNTEAPRAEARSVLTKLLYANSPPASWVSNDGKSDLTKRVSQYILKYATWVREAEHAVPRSGSALAIGSAK